MNSMQEYVSRAAGVLAQRYRDVSEVGQGRHGIVFKALAGDRSVAIKAAFPFMVGEEVPGAVAFFRREGELGAILTHPHILRTSPVEMLDGVEFYEMDYAGPLRLDHVVLQERPPTFGRVLAIMREVGAALDHAHAKGVLHGALRPTNVLLDSQGQVKLKGFVLRENERSPHPALEPGAVGDPAYMAPEQWRLPRVNRRVDVYAAGVLAYELFTGQQRVEYKTPGFPEIRPIELAPNRPLRDGVPLHVNAAIRKATAKDPAVRFASVGEFVEALANPDMAQGHGLPTHVPPLSRQRSSPLLLLLVVAIAAAAAILGTEQSRERVVKWGKSIWSAEAPTVDPLNIRESPARGSGSESKRGSGGATRTETKRAGESARDSTRPSGTSSRREESQRSEPGSRERRDATTSSARAETPGGATARAGGATAGTAEDDPDEGVIRVTADRGRAVVFVDGLPRGVAPVTVRARPGAHRISLRGTLTYDPRDMRIEVRRGDTAFAEFYATTVALPDTLLLSMRLRGLFALPAAGGQGEAR